MATVALTATALAVEIVTNFGSHGDLATQGYAGGLVPSSFPDGTSGVHHFVYDVANAGLGGGAALLEVKVVVTSPTSAKLEIGGGYGFAVDGTWWDVGEDLSFEISIKNALFQNITANYTVDANGAALRWSNATAANIAGTTISGGSSTRIWRRALATGQTNETSFTASRTTGSAAVQFSQLKFEIVNQVPLPGAVEVVTDLGSAAELNTQGYTTGIDPSSYPSGTSPTHLFSYDVSGAGVGGNAATLEVAVTSQNAAALTGGGGSGISVTGGSNSLWWEIGEDLDFQVRIRNSGGVDITRFFWVDLTGASLQWTNATSATVAGTSITGTGSATIIYKHDLPTGQIGETTFTAARAGASSACQFSQLRFKIASIPMAPTTFTSYAEAAATGTPPAGWAFYWNAPTGWAVGTPGNLATGPITDRNSWKPMLWSGTQWTADGDNTANNSPSDYLRLTGTGGNPGAAGASRDIDRHAISAFTIGQAGDYELLLGKVTSLSGSTGVLLNVFLNGALHEQIAVPGNHEADFSYIFNGLSVNDEIAVAVDGNGSSGIDTHALEYRIALLKPEYASPQVINVDAYGAVGNGVTDDGPALLAAIAAWKNILGPAALHFGANKTYFLGVKTDTKPYFVMNGISHKVVEGNGSKLLFTPSNRGFSLVDCDDIVVRNFTVDYSPVPFSQGVITAKDTVAGTITFQKTAGYPDPIKPSNKNWGTVYDPATLDLRTGIADHLYVDSITNLSGGTFRFQVRADYWVNIPGIQINDLFVFRAIPNDGIPGGEHHPWADISECGNLAFDNIVFYSTPAFAFTTDKTLEPLLFRNISITPPPGSGRLVSSFGDGFHCKGGRFGPVIEGCYFTYGMDDTINLTSIGSAITEIVSNNTVKVSITGTRVGDLFQFADAANKTVLGTATVTAISGTTITLDALPVGVQTNHYIYNASQAHAGYVVQNNTFGVKRRAAGLIYCPYGKIINNLVDGNAGFWIFSSGAFNGVYEGTFPGNILFQGNTIRNTDYGLWINASYMSGSERTSQHIQILDNVFEDNVNMNISGAGNVLILGNRFLVTPIATLNNVTDVTIGHSIDANGNFLPNEMGSLQGGYTPAEITIIPYNFSYWTANAGLFGEAALPTHDADFDGMDNQLEYALGGDPLLNDAANIRPSYHFDSGDWLYYVFNKRNDPSLTYSVQSSSDLASGTWAANGVEFVSESPMLNNFKTVTYRVPTAGKPQQFIRLKVAK